MLWWLVDNAATLYFILALAALVAAALWWRNRKKPYLSALGLVAVIAVAVWSLTRIVMTDQMRIEGICQEMAQGIRERNIDKIFTHISASFNQANRSAMNATQLRELAQRHLARRGTQDISFSKFSFEDIARETRKAKVQFWVLGADEFEGMPIRCEADFAFEAGDVWRMRGFKLFIGNTTNQYPFP